VQSIDEALDYVALARVAGSSSCIKRDKAGQAAECLVSAMMADRPQDSSGNDWWRWRWRRKGRWKWRKMDAEVDVKVVREVY
jgi:hypothetical protein